MSTTVVAVIAAVTSLAAAITTVLLGAMFERRRHAEQREHERQDHADRYSQPLLAAASSLASRLGNATPQQVREFSTTGGERYRSYLIHETLYRVARYLCWVHIITREIRALDLGNEDRNRELVKRIASVQHAISNRDGDLTFMLLGGEQAAIGELMVERDGSDSEPRCMSYVTFTERFDIDKRFHRWFDSLLTDLTAFAADPSHGGERLERIRAALNRLIELLDPKQIWVPFRDSD